MRRAPATPSLARRSWARERPLTLRCAQGDKTSIQHAKTQRVRDGADGAGQRVRVLAVDVGDHITHTRSRSRHENRVIRMQRSGIRESGWVRPRIAPLTRLHPGYPAYRLNATWHQALVLALTVRLPRMNSGHEVREICRCLHSGFQHGIDYRKHAHYCSHG